MIVEGILTFLSKIFCFASFVNNKGSFPAPLESDKEAQYLKDMHNGDKKARELLIRHNLRLVAHIVKKYTNAGEADDLISVGTIGLIKGIETFADGKGSMLATYCARCIDNEILMYIRANKKHRGSVSLCESAGSDKEGNEVTLMDVLPMENDNSFDRVENNLTAQKIKQLIDEQLTPREKQVICLRYGINGNEAHTQSEVAAVMDISRSYVSRIEKHAIEKLSKCVL